jgi:hypothetical protein
VLTSDACMEGKLGVRCHLPTRLDRTNIDSQDYGYVYESTRLVAMPDFGGLPCAEGY